MNELAVIPPLPGNLPDGAKPAPGGDDTPAGDAFSTAFARAKAQQALRPAGRAMAGTSDPAHALGSPAEGKLTLSTQDESADTEAANLGLTTADPALDLALLQSMRDQTATPAADAAATSPPWTAEAAPLALPTEAPPALPFAIALPVPAMASSAAPVPGQNRASTDALEAASTSSAETSPPHSASRPTPDGVLSELGAGMRAAPSLGANLASSPSGSTAATQERGFEAALAKLESGATQASTGTPAASILSPLAAAPLAALAQPRAPEAPPAVTATVHAPLPSPAFPEEAAQRLTWLVRNGVESASLRVTPADMGPIEIRIRLTQDEATIAFAVTQPESGRAIEDALPRLREMLSESGINLGHTSVESGNGGQFAAAEERARLLEARQLRGAQTAAPAQASLPVAVAPARGVGLVDLFA